MKITLIGALMRQCQGRSQTYIWVGSLEEKWTFLYDMIQVIKLGGSGGMPPQEIF